MIPKRQSRSAQSQTRTEPSKKLLPVPDDSPPLRPPTRLRPLPASMSIENSLVYSQIRTSPFVLCHLRCHSSQRLCQAVPLRPSPSLPLETRGASLSVLSSFLATFFHFFASALTPRAPLFGLFIGRPCRGSPNSPTPRSSCRFLEFGRVRSLVV